MTPDKAIEILEARQHNTPDKGYEFIKDATQLGIEALKTVKAERTIYGFKRLVRLPGETES